MGRGGVGSSASGDVTALVRQLDRKRRMEAAEPHVLLQGALPSARQRAMEGVAAAAVLAGVGRVVPEDAEAGIVEKVLAGGPEPAAGRDLEALAPFLTNAATKRLKALGERQQQRSAAGGSSRKVQLTARRQQEEGSGAFLVGVVNNEPVPVGFAGSPAGADIWDGAFPPGSAAAAGTGVSGAPATTMTSPSVIKPAGLLSAVKEAWSHGLSWMFTPQAPAGQNEPSFLHLHAPLSPTSAPRNLQRRHTASPHPRARAPPAPTMPTTPTDVLPADLVPSPGQPKQHQGGGVPASAAAKMSRLGPLPRELQGPLWGSNLHTARSLGGGALHDLPEGQGASGGKRGHARSSSAGGLYDHTRGWNSEDAPQPSYEWPLHMDTRADRMAGDGRSGGEGGRHSQNLADTPYDGHGYLYSTSIAAGLEGHSPLARAPGSLNKRSAYGSGAAVGPLASHAGEQQQQEELLAEYEAALKAELQAVQQRRSQPRRAMSMRAMYEQQEMMRRAFEGLTARGQSLGLGLARKTMKRKGLAAHGGFWAGGASGSFGGGGGGGASGRRHLGQRAGRFRDAVSLGLLGSRGALAKGANMVGALGRGKVGRVVFEGAGGAVAGLNPLVVRPHAGAFFGPPSARQNQESGQQAKQQQDEQVRKRQEELRRLAHEQWQVEEKAREKELSRQFQQKKEEMVRQAEEIGTMVQDRRREAERLEQLYEEQEATKKQLQEQRARRTAGVQARLQAAGVMLAQLHMEDRPTDAAANAVDLAWVDAGEEEYKAILGDEVVEVSLRYAGEEAELKEDEDEVELIEDEEYEEEEYEEEDEEEGEGEEEAEGEGEFEEEEEEVEIIEKAVPPLLPVLTDEAKRQVSAAFAPGSDVELLVLHEESNHEITRGVIHCLKPAAWLNDEVINLYLVLLKEREKRSGGRLPKCHFFNTFFYAKLSDNLSGYSYRSVKRWTSMKNIGYCILDCDKVIVPVHLGMHWVLAVIDIRSRKFVFLDSMAGSHGPKCLERLARYIVDEAKDKRNETWDVSDWEFCCPTNIPQQANTYDCGVFMLRFAECESRGAPYHFTQADMSYFRSFMAWELLQLQAYSDAECEPSHEK